MYYRSLTENDGMSREDFYIRLTADKENGTLTVSDNGCGMTAEELENNLGTIAKSGSLAFKQENEAKEDIDIIGQFGVGFYSAFMVADHVKVVSKPYGSEQAWCWSLTVQTAIRWKRLLRIRLYRCYPDAEEGYRGRKVQRLSGELSYQPAGQEILGLHPLSDQDDGGKRTLQRGNRQGW